MKRGRGKSAKVDIPAGKRAKVSKAEEKKATKSMKAAKKETKKKQVKQPEVEEVDPVAEKVLMVTNAINVADCLSEQEKEFTNCTCEKAMNYVVENRHEHFVTASVCIEQSLAKVEADFQRKTQDQVEALAAGALKTQEVEAAIHELEQQMEAKQAELTTKTETWEADTATQESKTATREEADTKQDDAEAEKLMNSERLSEAKDAFENHTKWQNGDESAPTKTDKKGKNKAMDSHLKTLELIGMDHTMATAYPSAIAGGSDTEPRSAFQDMCVDFVTKAFDKYIEDQTAKVEELTEAETAATAVVEQCKSEEEAAITQRDASLDAMNTADTELAGLKSEKKAQQKDLKKHLTEMSTTELTKADCENNETEFQLVFTAFRELKARTNIQPEPVAEPSVEEVVVEDNTGDVEMGDAEEAVEEAEPVVESAEEVVEEAVEEEGAMTEEQPAAENEDVDAEVPDVDAVEEEEVAEEEAVEEKVEEVVEEAAAPVESQQQWGHQEQEWQNNNQW